MKSERRKVITESHLKIQEGYRKSSDGEDATSPYTLNFARPRLNDSQHYAVFLLMPKPLANFFVMDVISCLKFAKKNESFC